MIPKIIHFNFGFAPNFASDVSAIPFSLFHFLAIKSAKIVNQYDVRLYYDFAPENNEWWERSKEFCTHVKVTAPTEIFGFKLPNAAGMADVFRLMRLNEEGGVHLDMDTLCIKPLDWLLNHSFVMGLEVANHKVEGLCNAVMLAEKGSEFGKLWLEQYRNFDPLWGAMGVDAPYRLYQEFPSLVTVLAPNAFFKYSWHKKELSNIFERVSSVDNAYVLHLWETCSYESYLKDLTPEIVKTKDTTYNLLARRFL